MFVCIAISSFAGDKWTTGPPAPNHFSHFFEWDSRSGAVSVFVFVVCVCVCSTALRDVNMYIFHVAYIYIYMCIMLRSG